MIIKDKYGNVGTKTKPAAAQEQCNHSMNETDFGAQCKLTDPKSLDIPADLSDIASVTIYYLCGVKTDYRRFTLI